METHKTSRGLALLLLFVTNRFNNVKQIQCYSVLLQTKVSLASTPVSWLLGHWKSVKENEVVVQVAWGMMMMESKVMMSMKDRVEM